MNTRIKAANYLDRFTTAQKRINDLPGNKRMQATIDLIFEFEKMIEEIRAETLIEAE